MEPSASPSRTDAALAAALFVAALLLQLAIFDRGAFYSDEGLLAQTAAEINRGKVPYRDIVMPLPGPAAFYLLAGVFRLTGDSFTAARATMAVMSSALTAFLYLLARGAMTRWTALLVGLAFLSCRLWAFPHWLFYHYASCAGFFTGLGYALVCAALGRVSPVPAALAGIAGGVALLAKQDVGGAGTLGLGIALLLLGGERRVVMGAAFAAGVCAVLLPTLALFAAAGALPSLFDQAVRTAFRGFVQFDYLRLPNLRPLFHQDPLLRAHLGEYAPSVLVTLYWDRITTSPLFRGTPLCDLAIKLVFFLPYAAVPLAGLALARSWGSSPLPPAGRRKRAGAALLVIYAAASLAAFSPPRDWLHLLVLYHPTLLLAGLLLDLGASRLGTRARRAVLGAATLATLLALLGTLRITRDLRRAFATPVPTAAGTVWLKREEAGVLADLLGYVAARTGPADPLPVIPYHPLIQFFARRTAGLSSYYFWPVRPTEDTDARLIADLEATRPGTIIYSVSQYAHLRRFRENFPDLFAYLVDHYHIARTFTPPQPWGAVFCGLERREPAPPPLVDLVGVVDQATVSVTRAGATQVLHGAARTETAGQALWPFRRVLYQRPAVKGESTIAFSLRIPPQARLDFGYGLNPDEWVSFSPAAVTFAVAVETGGSARMLFSATVDPQRKPAQRAWREAEIDLTEFGGKEVVLAFHTAAATQAGERSDLAGWAEPRLVGIVTPRVRVGGSPARPARAPPRPAMEVRQRRDDGRGRAALNPTRRR